MKSVFAMILAAVLSAGSTAALADQVSLSFGGDSYAAGQNASIAGAVVGDAFLMGYDVTLAAPVSGSAHLAGFTVNSNAEVTGDIYAAGFAVTISGSAKRNVTAMGNSVVLRTGTPLPGNARLAAASIVVDNAVEGSILASAGSMTLNAPVKGDFSFYGESLTFGPNAKVDGKVSIQAPKPIAVPASVAAADRVTFQQLTSPDYATEAGRTAENVVKGFWPAFWATMLWWLLLFVIGAAGLALLPRLFARLQVVSATHPFRRLGLGILTFASVIGLVPLAALTLVGILLVPFILIFVVIACSLAYLTGVYLAAVRIAVAFVAVDTNLKRVGVLAVSLVAAGLLTMIPFIGWLITLALLAFGFGTVAAITMARWSSGDAARLMAASPPAAATTPDAI